MDGVTRVGGGGVHRIRRPCCYDSTPYVIESQKIPPKIPPRVPDAPTRFQLKRQRFSSCSTVQLPDLDMASECRLGPRHHSQFLLSSSEQEKLSTMSRFRLGRVLLIGGVIDAATTAHRYVGLLRAGQFFAILGIVLIVGTVLVPGTSSPFLVLGAVLSLVLAALLLFSFASAAKLYGQMAVAFVLLFLGACFGLIAVGTDRSQPPAELTGRSLSQRAFRPPVTTSEPVNQSPATQDQSKPAEAVSPARAEQPTPAAPAIPPEAKRMIAQVYIVNETQLYYTEDCASRPKNALLVPKAIAQRQGYVLAPECSGN